MEIIVAICALILGLLIGFFAVRKTTPDNTAELAELKSSLFAKEAEISALKLSAEDRERYHKSILEEKENSFAERIRSEKESNRRELDSLNEKNKDLIDALEKRHAESLEALKAQFEEAAKSMGLRLQNITESMLKQRQKEFSESSEEKLGVILQPLKDSLKAMQEKVTENTTSHTKLGGELSAGIKNLLDHTEAAQASAEKLATILKGNTKHQGEWGERILKEILESLNLQEGIHFDVQKTMTDEKGYTVKNEEGRMGRPDIVLHLDRDKDVIIDSKVSLSSYLQFREAETEEERQEALRKHIQSLEKHVAELVRKDYSSYVKEPRARLGYVIMFVPNTSALLLATQTKPTLWREAMEKNVYIADEQTLYAALKIVSLTWQQIHQNESHAKVYKLAEEMLQRVANFMKAYTDIGEQIAKASKSYEEGRKKLEEGGQSIPNTCRKLIKLGAKPPKITKGVDKTLFGISVNGGNEEPNSYIENTN